MGSSIEKVDVPELLLNEVVPLTDGQGPPALVRFQLMLDQIRLSAEPGPGEPGEAQALAYLERLEGAVRRSKFSFRAIHRDRKGKVTDGIVLLYDGRNSSSDRRHAFLSPPDGTERRKGDRRHNSRDAT